MLSDITKASEPSYKKDFGISADQLPRGSAYRHSQRRPVQPGDGVWDASLRKLVKGRLSSSFGLMLGDVVAKGQEHYRFDYVSASATTVNLVFRLTGSAVTYSDFDILDVKEDFLHGSVEDELRPFKYRGRTLDVDCVYERPDPNAPVFAPTVSRGW